VYFEKTAVFALFRQQAFAATDAVWDLINPEVKWEDVFAHNLMAKRSLDTPIISVVC